MPGLFDDLVPAKPKNAAPAGGLFDDLMPSAVKTSAAPNAGNRLGDVEGLHLVRNGVAQRIPDGYDFAAEEAATAAKQSGLTTPITTDARMPVTADGSMLSDLVSTLLHPIDSLQRFTAPIARGMVKADKFSALQRGATSALASGVHAGADFVDQTVQAPFRGLADVLDVTGFDAIRDPLGAKALADESLAVNQQIGAERSAVMAQMPRPGLGDFLANPGASLENMGERYTTMGTESVPLYALAVASRNPALASGVMGASTGAQEYTDLRGDGIGRGAATQAGVLSALVEAGGEGYSLPKVMGKASAGSLGGAVIAEGAQEFPVAIAQQNINDQATGKATPILQQILDGIDAAVIGGAMGGGAHVGSNLPAYLAPGAKPAAPVVPDAAPSNAIAPTPPELAPDGLADITPDDVAAIGALLTQGQPAAPAAAADPAQTAPDQAATLRALLGDDVAAALGLPPVDAAPEIAADPDAPYRRPATESAPAAPSAIAAEPDGSLTRSSLPVQTSMPKLGDDTTAPAVQVPPTQSAPALGGADLVPADAPRAQAVTPPSQPIAAPAAPRKPAVKVDKAGKPLDLLRVIAANGGLNREAFRAQGVDPAEFTRRAGFNYVFRKDGGMRLPDLREFMQQEGYLARDPEGGVATVDDNDALDVFDRAFRSGEAIFSDDQGQAVAAYQAATRSADEAFQSELAGEAAQEADLADIDDFDSFMASGNLPEYAAETNRLTERAYDLGATDEQIIAAGWDVETADTHLANLQAIIEELDRADTDPAAAESPGASTEPGRAEPRQEAQPVALGDFALDAPSAKPAAQEVAPTQGGGLFGAPKAADFVQAAIRNRDEKRDGKTGTGRTDMAAGDGELFAGKRPEQASVPDALTFNDSFSAWHDLERGRGKPSPSQARLLDTLRAMPDVAAEWHPLDDATQQVAKALGVPASKDFQTQVYSARRVVQGESNDRANTEALGAFSVGQTFKGVQINSNTYSSLTIDAIDGATIKATGTKRGSSRRWDVTLPARELAKVTPKAEPVSQTTKADEPAAVAETPKPPKETPIEPQKIEDIGEKLGGARKDRAPSLSRELSDDDIASQPLSKIWPAEEIDGIENVLAAATAYVARAEIPAKPRVKYKVDRWVKTVNLLRGLAQSVVNTDMTHAQMVEVARKNGRGLDGFLSKIDLLSEIPRESWGRIGAVSEHPNAYRITDGKTVQTPIVQVEVDGRNNRFDASAVGEVLDQVRGLLGVAKAGKAMAFEVRGKAGAWGINKKGDKEYRKLKTFADSKEALAYVRDNNAALVELWEGVKDSDNVKKTDTRREDNRERAGTDHRDGKDVTGDQFVSTFGFRGVEFGNWVSQGGNAKERQGMLNQAFDALMDLAGIVGVPPKALSLNGSLGLGFGSRGSGKASAHFEPGNLVINLTKTRGAGALAHEWFHALDNYFARQRGEKPMTRALDAQKAYRENNFITYRPEPMMVHATQMSSPLTKARLADIHAKNPQSGYYDPANWKVDPKHPDGVRPEVEQSFAALVQTLNESPMSSRARSLDKKSDGYWSQIIERGARSFENYVIFKMTERGVTNDYLANVRTIEDFPRAKSRYPYLLPEEVAPVAAAFDDLFATIESREDADGNVALFARDATIRQSTRGDANAHTPSGIPAGLPIAGSPDTVRLERALGPFARRGGQAPRFRAVRPDSLPDALSRAFAALERISGARVVVVRNVNPEQSGLTFNGVTLREGVLFVDEAAQHPATTVAAHEFVHQLYRDRPDLYAVLEAEVRRQGRLPEWLAELESRGETRAKTVGVEELVADAVGDALTDRAFLEGLAQRNPSKFKQLADAFLSFLDSLLGRVRDLGSNRYMTDVQAFRDVLADVLEQYDPAGKAPTAGAAPMFQTAYHGTPHTVDKFSLQKIGTGEGAQAYGYGLYFASQREIAEHYRDTLSAPSGEIEMDALAEALFNVVLAGQPVQAGSVLVAGESYTRARFIEAWVDGDITSFDFPMWQTREAEKAFIGGNLYQVDVPEDSDLLDYDKPLSEQSEKVRAAIAASPLIGRESDGWAGAPAGQFERNVFSRTGKVVYLDLVARLGTDQKRASEHLMSIGIPGLRYADGNTRGKAEQSHNYVIWDEAAISDTKPLFSRSATDRKAEPDTDNVAQFPQVATAAFRRWFGDSKVVDDNGKPLVMHHGTGEDFWTFTDSSGSATGHSTSPFGFFFTSNPELAQGYADNASQGVPADARVVDVYLAIDNPYAMTLEEAQAVDSPEEARSIRAWLERQGFDGINIAEADNWIAFDAKQVKSASENSGAFDPDNGDIRFSVRPADALRDTTPRPKTDTGPRSADRPAHKPPGWVQRAREDIAGQIADFRQPRIKNPESLLRRADNVRGILTDSIVSRAFELEQRNKHAPSLKTLFRLFMVQVGTSDVQMEPVNDATEARFATFTNRVRNVLNDAGLRRMDATENAQLRTAMLGTDRNVPQRIRTAADRIRVFMDNARQDMLDAGIEVGEVDDIGYLNRIYDEGKILADEAGFTAAAATYYRGEGFANDVGATARDTFYGEGNLARFLSHANRAASTDGDVAEALLAIREAVKRYRYTSNTNNDAAVVRRLVDSIRDRVADSYADNSASAWLHRIKTPNLQDLFNGVGPSGAPLTKARVLGGSADTIMAGYMNTDMLDILDTYARTASKKIEHAVRFGPKNERVQQLIDAASREGVSAPDLKIASSMIESLMQPVTWEGSGMGNVASAIHATTYLALLPKATFASMAEGITTAIRTGDLTHVAAPLIQIGRTVTRSKHGAELNQLAETIGVNGQRAVEEVLMNRIGGDFTMTPKWGALTTRFFRAILLSQLTRAQRAYATGAATGYLRTLATDHRKGKPEARVFLNELGIADHAAFAEWMLGLGDATALPDSTQLFDANGRPTPRGQDYMVAVRRVVNQAIQSVKPEHKPQWANSRAGKLLTPIMGFGYASYENLIKRESRLQITLRDEVGRGAMARRAGVAAGGALALTAGVIITTTLREVLLNAARFEDKDEEEIAKEMILLGATRTFGLGTGDPMIQWATGIKYRRSAAETATGAGIGTLMKTMDAFAAALQSDTDTARYKAAEAAYQSIVTPFLNAALSRLPGGLGAAPILAVSHKDARAQFAGMFGDQPDRESHLDKRYKAATKDLDALDDSVKQQLAVKPKDQWAAELDKLKAEYAPLLDGVTLDVYVDNTQNRNAGKVGPKATRDGVPKLRLGATKKTDPTGSVLGELEGYTYGYSVDGKYKESTSEGIADKITALNKAIKALRADDDVSYADLMGFGRAAKVSMKPIMDQYFTQSDGAAAQANAPRATVQAVLDELQDLRRAEKRAALAIIDKAKAGEPIVRKPLSRD